MTATEMLDRFVATLDGLIEGALARVRDASELQAAATEIEQLISAQLPAILEAFGEDGPGDLERERLEACLARLAGLEMKASARLVWGQDFEDYIRTSRTTGD